MEDGQMNEEMTAWAHQAELQADAHSLPTIQEEPQEEESRATGIVLSVTELNVKTGLCVDAASYKPLLQPPRPPADEGVDQTCLAQEAPRAEQLEEAEISNLQGAPVQLPAAASSMARRAQDVELFQLVHDKPWAGRAPSPAGHGALEQLPNVPN
ncbi:hypothetical protein EK904_013329, partial [Melospiza melodia maxima]